MLLGASPRDELKREAKKLRKELKAKDKDKEAKAEDSKESTLPSSPVQTSSVVSVI